MPLHTVCHVNKVSTKLSPAFASVRLENETNQSINIIVCFLTILNYTVVKESISLVGNTHPGIKFFSHYNRSKRNMSTFLLPPITSDISVVHLITQKLVFFSFQYRARRVFKLQTMRKVQPDVSCLVSVIKRSASTI